MAEADKSASELWYERYENRRDSPRVSVWWPSSIPYARLQVTEHGCEEPPTLPSGDLIAYLTISGIEFGGRLDDLELLLAAATEELARTRAHANELQSADLSRGVPK